MQSFALNLTEIFKITIYSIVHSRNTKSYFQKYILFQHLYFSKSRRPKNPNLLHGNIHMLWATQPNLVFQSTHS